MSDYGLLVDIKYCTGCLSCDFACNQEFNFPLGQSGIKVSQIGPWDLGNDKYEYLFAPTLTELCDLCEKRVANGKLPTCVQHCQSLIMSYGPLDELVKKMDGKSKQLLLTRGRA